MHSKTCDKTYNAVNTIVEVRFWGYFTAKKPTKDNNPAKIVAELYLTASLPPPK